MLLCTAVYSSLNLVRGTSTYEWCDIRWIPNGKTQNHNLSPSTAAARQTRYYCRYGKEVGTVLLLQCITLTEGPVVRFIDGPDGPRSRREAAESDDRGARQQAFLRSEHHGDDERT